MAYNVRQVVQLSLNPRYEGAQVEVLRDLPLGDWLRIRKLGTEADEEGRAAWTIFCEKALIGWNLEDDQGPIPPTIESLERVPALLVRDIIEAWVRQIGELTGPLDTPSSAGLGLVEASTAMATE